MRSLARTRRRLGTLLLLALVPAAPAHAQGLVTEPVRGTPGGFLHLFGAAPLEEPGLIFGHDGTSFVRYSDADGWRSLGAPEPRPDAPVVTGELRPLDAGTQRPGSGSVTARGAAVALAREGTTNHLVVRDPGGTRFERVAPPEAEALALPLAAVDEPGNRAGALLGAGDHVLHFDGAQWTTERIESATPPTIVALDATALENAWLVADHADGPVLYRRELRAGAPVWTPRGVALEGFANVTAAAYPNDGLAVSDTTVWIDLFGAAAGNVRAGITLRYDIADARVGASWCTTTAGCTAGRKAFGGEGDTAGYRSYAFGAERTVVQPGTVDVFTGTSAPTRSYTIDGTNASAALLAPTDGWIGGGPVVRVHPGEPLGGLQRHPAPFRRPVLGVALQPGVPGATAQAIGVGPDGTVGRFVPGVGWRAEYLTDDDGSRARPSLRAVAWPEPGYAYAVGDEGEMWTWSAGSGRWQRDGGRPDGLAAPLTSIAFAHGNPSLGYAVGRNGTLLRYDKDWLQELLPNEFARASLTSVSFAGTTALVVAQRRQTTNPGNPTVQIQSDLLVNDGTGWRPDLELRKLLPEGATMVAVAGLADGGIAVVGNRFAAYRDAPDAPWRVAERPLEGVIPFAVAAVRDGSQVRAVVAATPVLGGTAIGGSSRVPGVVPEPYADEFAPPSNPDEPVPADGAFRPPRQGVLLRDTAQGWRDEQRARVEVQGDVTGAPPNQDPGYAPDPIAAVALDASGVGWAVGGVTYGVTALMDRQTSALYRYPAAPEPVPGTATADIPLDPTKITLAFGGGAGCVGVGCIAREPLRRGGETNLAAALDAAGALSLRPGGPKAFLYTGARIEKPDAQLASTIPGLLGSDDVQRYGQLLGRGAKPTLGVYAAPAGTDRAGAEASRALREWSGAMAALPAPLGSGELPAGIEPVRVSEPRPLTGARTHYAFDVTGEEGRRVRVAVLDLGGGAVTVADQQQNPPGQPQLDWLKLVADDAKASGVPLIVVSNATLNPPQAGRALLPGELPGTAELQAVARAVRDAGASAHVFESWRQNRRFSIPAGEADQIPSFGTGTLNSGGDYYTNIPIRFDQTGFLLLEIDPAAVDGATGRAPVRARMVPLVSELALEAVDGTRLRRSQPALFRGLARKPLGGQIDSSDPYVALPATDCPKHAACATRLEPEYAFASSDPDIADFVARDPNSANPRAVRLGADGEPTLDASSGLLCPFNAGETTISIRAGGQEFRQRVTVEPGDVKRPCGTTPLSPARFPAAPPIVRPPALPSSAVQTSAPPEQPPAAGRLAVDVRVPAREPEDRPRERSAPRPPVQPPAPVPFVPQIAVPPALPPTPPPPPAGSPARPTPPSGTAPVQSSSFSNVPAPRVVEEEERATQEAHNAAAYTSPAGHGPAAGLILAVVLLAAGVGYGARGHGSPGRRPRPLPVRVTSTRTRNPRSRRRR